MRFWALPLLLVPAAAFCQVEFEHPGGYPAYRTLSGLPGGGFGVLPDGTASMKGALAFSSPIAYSLGHTSFYMGADITSQNQQLRFDFNFHSKVGDVLSNGGHGTGVAIFGYSTKVGDISGAYEVLSGKLNAVYNFEFTPKQDSKIATFAFGVVDAHNHGSYGGQAYDTTHHGLTSRSFFAVATRPVGDRTYVSVGVGSARFHTPFANASYGITDRIRATAEYDGFNFNYGLGADLGPMAKLLKHPSHVVMFLGDIRGKYITWTAGITF